MATNAAHRALQKGKKRQKRRKVAKLHKMEFFVMNNADRATALKVMRDVERREKRNIKANHTKKVGQNNERQI